MRVQTGFGFVFLAAAAAFSYPFILLQVTRSLPTEFVVEPPEDLSSLMPLFANETEAAAKERVRPKARRKSEASRSATNVSSRREPDRPRPAVSATFHGWPVPRHILSHLSDLAGFEDAYDASAATSLRRRNRRRAEALRKEADAWGESLVCNATAVPFPPHQGRKVRFLHVPKTGSTFFNTLARYGCYAQRDEVPYIGDRKPNCTSNELRANAIYGRLCEYDSDEMVPVLVEKCSPLWFHQPPFYGKNISVDYTTNILHHEPVMKDGEAQAAVGLFRLPNQRLVSAFDWNYHASRMRTELRRYLIRVVMKENNTPSAFARFPGVRGCQTKMLTGTGCGSMIVTKFKNVKQDVHPLGPMCYLQPEQGGEAGKEEERVCAGPGEADVKAAIRRVHSLAFAGVMEQWQLSVCLFHRLLGGEVGEVELRKTHVQSGDKGKASVKPLMYKYDAGGRSDLGGFIDIADELLYAAVLDSFGAKLNCVLLKLHRGEEDTEICAKVTTD